MPSGDQQTTNILIGVVVVLILALGYWFAYDYKRGGCRAAAAGVPATPPAPTPAHGKKKFTGPQPNWHLGGDDSGNGGSMHRATTIHQSAAAARANPHFPTKPTCPAGQSPVQYTDPSGHTMTHCVESGAASAMTCGGTWHPESVSQVQALASMGAIDVHSAGADPSLVHAAAGRKGRGNGPTDISASGSLSA